MPDLIAQIITYAILGGLGVLLIWLGNRKDQDDV